MQRLFFYQFAITFFAATLWLLLGDVYSGLSVFCGGMAWIMPNFLVMKKFLQNIFSPRHVSPLHVIKNFYLGELIKILLSAFLVILFITKCSFVKTFPFLIGYVIATQTIWLQPFLWKFKMGRNA
jgi:F0F1-type ATP synthase assembly protein I